MEEKAACWRTGIDAVGQAAEIHPAGLQFRYERNQIAHATTKAIELPDNQYFTIDNAAGNLGYSSYVMTIHVL